MERQHVGVVGDDLVGDDLATLALPFDRFDVGPLEDLDSILCRGLFGGGAGDVLLNSTIDDTVPALTKVLDEHKTTSVEGVAKEARSGGSSRHDRQ